jgi:hypothetical protein
MSETKSEGAVGGVPEIIGLGRAVEHMKVGCGRTFVVAVQNPPHEEIIDDLVVYGTDTDPKRAMATARQVRDENASSGKVVKLLAVSMEEIDLDSPDENTTT